MTAFPIEEVRRAVAETIQTHLKSIRSPWYDNDAAAGYLTCSPGTLKTWRARGEGPRYQVINQKLIRYHVTELDRFVRGEAA